MDKYKINIQKVEERQNNHLSSKFKNFLYDNKDTEFTVSLVLDRNNIKLYTLNEDSNDPKWVFFDTDLIKL